jgi:hypothetical protein
MIFSQELEKQINTSLIVLGVKMKALKATLTPEQLGNYNKTIQEEKTKVVSSLSKLLTQKELEDVIKSIDS